jgi:putative FmdB family regulatory protein
LPTYEYHCDTCARNFDVVQSFHDAPLDACPTCGGPVRKVFGTVGIVFKGSGFYKTDSRTAAKATAKAGDGASPSGSDGARPDQATGGSDSGESSGESTAPATPASNKTPSKPTPAASPSGNGSPRTAKESATT